MTLLKYADEHPWLTAIFWLFASVQFEHTISAICAAFGGHR